MLQFGKSDSAAKPPIRTPWSAPKRSPSPSAAPRARRFFALPLWRRRKHALQLRPLGDRVVIRRVEQEERSPAGIIIPDTARRKPREGEVIAAGPGGRRKNGAVAPLAVQPGDRVVFGEGAGTEVRVGGESLVILRETDILGVVPRAARVG